MYVKLPPGDLNPALALYTTNLLTVFYLYNKFINHVLCMIILGFSIKVVDIVLTGMYRTGIEILMLRTSLNIGQFRVVSGVLVGIERNLFFFFLVL